MIIESTSHWSTRSLPHRCVVLRRVFLTNSTDFMPILEDSWESAGLYQALADAAERSEWPEDAVRRLRRQGDPMACSCTLKLALQLRIGEPSPLQL